MASGPPTNARVNSARTRALALGPPDIGFGQRIRNATIESNSARPSPAPTRKTQSATARVLPNTVQRPAQPSTPRSTNNSPSQPKIAARLPSSSTQAHLPSTRSPTIAFNSRIARPRAISTTSPTTPTGLPSRVRTLSSITPSTKSHLGSPIPSSIKSLNTSSASSTTTPRPSNSVKPSPRPTPTFRLATDSGIVSLTNSTSTKSIDHSTKRDSLINARGSRSEVGQKRKTQSTQSSQNNVERNTSEVTSDLSLSAEDVDMLKGVWEDSPVNPDAFDPGESSTVDRAAVKSGYGSVFGFNMVSKSRNSLAEGFSEDRSQSASSIGSTLSHFSVETTKIVSPVPSSPADQSGSQAAPELASSIPSQPSPPSPETTAPSIVSVSPTAQRLHSNSSMLQSSLPSQSTFLSPDSLDVYTAVRYLRTSVSSSGLRSEVPSEDLDRMNSSSRPSGSMSRVSLPVTARSKPKSTPASHVTPSTRVIPGSSRTPFSAKDSSTQQTKDRNVSVAKASRITAVTNPSEYLPTPLHPDRTVVIRAASPEESTNHKHPTELSSTVDSMSSPPYIISHSFTGQSYGQRHTSSASPMSSYISPTSADLSGPSMHSYSPPGPSPTHPPTVNLKRLLSKPAPAGNSSASESEGGAITMKSQSVRRIERVEEKKEKQRIEAYNKERALESDAEYVPTLENSRERDRARKTEWEAERRLLKERNLPHSRPATSHSTDSSLTRQRSGFGGLVRSASWSRSREREGTDNTEKKAKNLLKKRPSAVSVAAPPDASKMEFPYSSFAPAYTGSILPATRQVIPSGSLMPPTSGHSSSRGSSPAPQDKRRSLIPHSALLKQGIVSDDGASISSGTTPAKEIMLAYKQQQEREKIRERERNERALEKQRERELWQQEDKDRQQRALEDQALFASRNISSIPLPAPIPKSNSSRDKIPTEIHSRLHQSPSAPNSGAASDHSRSVQPSNPQLPSQPEKGSNEAESFGEESSQPYYTVLGSSRRVVAAEGIKIQDSFLPDFTLSTSNLVEGISSSMGVGLGLGEPSGSPENEVSRPSTQRSASVTVGKPSLKSSSSFSIGIGKTLSRKMSGRLGASKRGPSFDISSAPTSTTSFIQENIRPSLHERRMVPGKESGNSSPRADKRSLRLSMDDYATTKGALSSPKNSPPTRRTQEGGIRSPLFKSSLVTSPQPSPTSASSHSSSKNKIWNLMKRISTGALRDNYRDTGAGLLTSPLPQPPPPPVPALPKDFSVYPKQMMRKHSADVTEIQTIHKRNATLSTIQSPNGKSPSAGSIRAPMNPARMNASSGTPTSTSTRAGTATRSSSPISSSDIGSSKFFNRSQSQRSSSSSYGEQIPPVPAVAPGKTVQLQQHILPPSELYQLHLDLERNNDDSQTRPVTSSTNYAHSLSSLNTTPSIPHPRSQVNLKLQTQQKSSLTEEWMIVPTPKEEKPAFSLPIPRRPKGSNNTEEVGSPRPPNGYVNRPASPTIHMLSNEAMISSQASTSGTSRTSQIGGFGSPVAPASIGASSICSAESGLSGESSLSRLSSPPAIPLKSPRRMTSASSASSIVNTRVLSSVMPPLPTTQSPAMPGRQQKLPEEHMKTDVESPSRRVMRKSFGFGTPSERYPVDHVRKRTNSNSSRPRTSPAAQYSSITHKNPTPSRLPRSETLQNSKSHTFGALSDKEKDDKWDDLLERSKRAGGTLHLNGGSDGLASDKLGFSVNDSEDDM
ncbi:hypothetical protein GGU10DRAFT_92343 [Lentinula aff. detonsa]|uniref:Uncharacterized protein n=1 Tax=Lentinula aff. detonsa TaxID=2804958 RepID=A0AA38KUK1_9AGAR|nr:hypothetical protein GGU10DRAFT_92343 [Lentinula aff. detonsa]